MLQTVSVATSGVAFSLLLYENVKTEHDKNGFLLGEIISQESTKLTDADHHVVNIKRTINVKSIIPCPQEYYFYDYSGKINDTKLKRILGSEMKNVVGWYVFRNKCSSPPKLNFREKIIHKGLMEYFEHPAYFSCCLLTSDCSKISSNYSFIQTFIRYNMPDYENVALHINNLSDPNFKFKSAESTSKVLETLIKKRANKTESLDINKIQDSLQEYIKELVVKLPEKEKELFDLEQEVRGLRFKLQQSKDEKNIKSENEDVKENGVFSHLENADSMESKKKKQRIKSKPADVKIFNNEFAAGDTVENSNVMRTRSKKNFESSPNK